MAVPWFQAAQHASAFLGPVFKAAAVTAVGRARSGGGNANPAQRGISSKAVGGPIADPAANSLFSWGAGGGAAKGATGATSPASNAAVPPPRRTRARHTPGGFLTSASEDADSDGQREEDVRSLDRWDQMQAQQTQQPAQTPASQAHQRHPSLAANITASFGMGRSAPMPARSQSLSHPARVKVMPSGPADALNAPASTMVNLFTNTDEQNQAMSQALALQMQQVETDRLLAEAATTHEELDDEQAEGQMATGEAAFAPSHAAAASASAASASSHHASSSAALLESDTDVSQQTTMRDIAGYFLSMPAPVARSQGPAKMELRAMDHNEVSHFARHTPERKDSWILLLRILGAKGMFDDGMRVYADMKRRGFEADDEQTYTTMVTVCNSPTESRAVNMARVKQAWAFFEELKTRRAHVTETFFNALSNCVARLDSIDAAEKVIKLMNEHGVPPSCITYTELISACRKTGQVALMERAVKYFEIMKKGGVDLQPDTQAYNVMIRVCGELKKKEATEYAVKLFDEMREKHYQPDRYTYSALIHACSQSTNHYTQSFEYFAAALAQGFKADVSLYNILLSSCAKAGSGDVANAIRLWNMMVEQKVARTTISYNTLLNVIAESMGPGKGDHVPRTIPVEGQPLPKPEEGFSKEERIEMATDLYNQMKQEHVAIDLTTVNTRVKVNAKALRLQVTPKLQEELMRENGFQRDAVSYRTLLDMYLGATRFPECLAVIDEMHGAGFSPHRDQYLELLGKLRTNKKHPQADIEKWGTQVLQRMSKDRMKPSAELGRLFDVSQFAAHLRAKNQAALQADTVKTGVVHSYSQRMDAMMRPSHKRAGSGRQGSQADRQARNPQLAKYAQKREQRESDRKDKGQGIKSAKQKQQAINDGHIYERE